MNAFTLTGEFLLKGDRQAMSSMDAIDKKAGGLGGAFTKMGKIAAIGFAAIGTAAIAVGGMLVKVGKDFDDAYNTIRIGTGATGEALEDMQGIVKNMATTIPGNLGDMGYAVAELNTRLNLTGDALEGMSTQMVNLARITKGDINTIIPATTRLFGDWSIAAEDQSKTLDWLMKVSQNTGIGVTELSEKVVFSGASLRQMGFDFESATLLLGKFEKEGVNTETMLSSLKIGLNNMAKEGITDANEALALLMDRIKEAPSDLEAVSIAAEVFGSRASADMAAAIREGRFDLEDLQETMKNSKDTINGLAEETMTLGERFELFKNKVFVAVEPLAKNLMNAFKGIIDVISTAVIPKIVELVTAFTPLINKIVEFIPILADKLIPIFTKIADVVIPIVTDIFGVLIDEVLPPLMDLFSKLASTILPPLMALFGEIVSRIMPPFMEIFGVIVDRILPPFLDLFTIIIEKVLPPFMDLFMILVDTILPPLIDFFAMLVETIMPPFIEILEILMEILKPFIDIFAELLAAILPPLIEIFAQLVKAILPPLFEVLKLIINYALKPLLELFGRLIEWAMPYLVKGIEFLTNVIIPAIIGIFTNWQEKVEDIKIFFELFAEGFMILWGNIRDFFIGIWENILEKIDIFKEKFLEVWNGIKEGIKVPINAIIRFINRLIDGLAGMINAVVGGLNRLKIKMPDWLGGKSFGFNLKEVSFKNIPELARGGIITSPGFALVGDEGPELLRLPQGASVEPLTSPSIENKFYISEFIVREEADVYKVAKELFNMQRTALAGVGIK